MKLIVGSSALNYFGMARREPNDLDILYTGEEPEGKVDSHKVPVGILKSIPHKDGYATPDAVYTLKLSHFPWDIHWEKTKQDILWLKAKGCKIDLDLYHKLKSYWETEHGDKSFLSLDKKKDEFFNDFVDYKYDHDSLHLIVSSPSKPLYEKALVEGKEVLVDKDKFFKLPFEEQIGMFREEISVIAFERWYVTGKYSWLQSHIKSLKKTITNLTKGWATDFITHNLEHFLKPDYTHFYKLTGGTEMSKVDLTPFKELSEKLGTDLDELVHNLCENDVYVSNSAVGIEYPDRAGRNYNDASYQEEISAYHKTKQNFLDNIVGDYEHLQQEGGGEGGSEYCYGVFRLGDTIYRAEYNYYSHQGHDYDYILDTLKVVTPKQKTITVYE